MIGNGRVFLSKLENLGYIIEFIKNLSKVFFALNLLSCWQYFNLLHFKLWSFEFAVFETDLESFQSFWIDIYQKGFEEFCKVFIALWASGYLIGTNRVRWDNAKRWSFGFVAHGGVGSFSCMSEFLL